MDASTNAELPIEPVVTEPTPSETPVAETKESRFAFDWQKIVQSPAFIPGVAITIGFFALFWGMLINLPTVWLGEDGYYSHGFLVPLISGYVVYRWWPRLKEIRVKPVYIALIPMAAFLWVGQAAMVNRLDSIASVCMLGVMLCAIAFIGGWRWLFALALPTLYLAFAMPVWNLVINNYTNPLQVLSTKVSYKMLEYTNFNPIKPPDENIIYLNGFTLDVGVPCSGFKLVLALAAFTVFFMLVGNFRWWANVLLAAFVLPLALFVNGLRIALIGVVGVNYGNDAGHAFHDYSGYISLIVCFFILFKFARLLGWKD